MDDFAKGRRTFLKGGLAALVTAASGCYGAVLKDLGKPCPRPDYAPLWLRVASYNIANARGDYDELLKQRPEYVIRHNLDQKIAMLQHEKVDVICMNEVDFDSRRSYGIDQAEYIAKGLCYNHVLKERIFSVPGLFDSGNAVISRYPIKFNRLRQYGDNFLKRIKHIFKSYIDFDVYPGDRKLNFVMTHLDANSINNRHEEISVLLRYIGLKRYPFVFLGDFNVAPGENGFNRLHESGLLYNPNIGLPTHPSTDPKRAIDNIWISETGRKQGMDIKNYHTVHITTSDHRPIIADIKLP
jgi:endonuclease/exonuclease/phosphatase family metal-dependent hydrolase